MARQCTRTEEPGGADGAVDSTHGGRGARGDALIEARSFYAPLGFPAHHFEGWFVEGVLQLYYMTHEGNPNEIQLHPHWG